MSVRTLQGEAKLLRIFIGESDFVEHTPLYMVLVEKARKDGLAGATVLRGIAGFGASSIIHSQAGLFKLSHDFPIIVEIIDTAENIKSFLKDVDPLLTKGLVTEEKVTVYHYRYSQKSE